MEPVSESAEGVEQRFFELLSQVGVESKLDAGAYLWQEGEAGRSAALVLDGALEVTSETGEGEVLVLRTLRRGALLGEMSSLEGSVHSATVRAAEPCVLRVISAAQLRAALDAHPELWPALLRVQSERVRSLTRQMAVLAFDPVTRRVARHLLEAVDPGSVLLRGTHQELAEHIAATRESVTKALGALSRAGAVRLRRGLVEVADRNALQQLVE